MRKADNRRTDNELVHQCLAGDLDAFEALLQRHQPGLDRYLRRAAGTRLDPDDLRQDVFLKAWEHLRTFRFQARFSTWLVSIARNHIIEMLRRKSYTATQQLTRPHSDLIRSPERDALSELCSREAASQVRSIVYRLPEDSRRILELRDLREMNCTEVARQLGVSTQVLKLRHFRARRKLAVLMDAACSPLSPLTLRSPASRSARGTDAGRLRAPAGVSRISE